MAQIKPIPEDKQLTQYELAHVLEDCAKVLLALPNCVIRNVEANEQSAYDRIEEIIKGVNNRLVKLENQLAESEKAIDDACEAHYSKTSKAISGLNQRLAMLPNVQDITRIPYNAKDIFQIAEQCSRLTDEQWKRVIELAWAFAGK